MVKEFLLKYCILLIVVCMSATIPAIFCAKAAKDKNRNPVIWFFLGLFFNYIAWVYLLFYVDGKGIINEIKESWFYQNKKARYFIIAFIILISLFSYYWVSYLPNKRYEQYKARQERIQMQDKNK